MKVVRLVIRLVSVVQEKGEYGESGHRDEAFRDTHHRERHASLSVVRCTGEQPNTRPKGRSRTKAHSLRTVGHAKRDRIPGADAQLGGEEERNVRGYDIHLGVGQCEAP